MVNIVYDSPDGAKNYTIGLLADSLENYPKGMTTTIYVRSARHQSERDGLPTEREEFPARSSGLGFVGAVLKVPEKPNFGYRRGIYAIFLNGYVVSLEVQARDEERIPKCYRPLSKSLPKETHESFVKSCRNIAIISLTEW